MLLFKNKMHSLIQTHIPSISVTERSESPWFNVTLKRLNNRKKRLFRSAKHINTPSAWDKYRNAERTFESLARKTKHSFYALTLPNMLRSNPRQFWRTINPKPPRNISLHDDQDMLIPENEISNVLNTAFCSVFTSEPGNELPSFPLRDHSPMPEITFDPSGIAKLIDSLKLTSSAGIDGINSKVLKSTKHTTSVILSHIFQQSLSSGTVPQDWKVGKVIPVPKKGNPFSPNNYRPISLTSVCSKLMEHIIYSHIAKFLSDINFFHPNQHGFRRGLSCDTQLALFINDISHNLDTNTPVDALFLDFEKAFDKVPHKRLFLKLSSLSLNNLVVNWIQDFLTNRHQFVFTNSGSSPLSPIISGVPQGTVLGPLLFLIYINDLPDNISSNIRLFADDCVIYRPINNLTDVNALQSDLVNIQTWCEKWLMTLNTRKSSLLTFHRRQSQQTRKYTFFDSDLSSVTTYKYLGINLSADLSWTDHITKLANEASRTLGYLRRNLRLAPSSVKLLTYCTFLRPKLEYACAIWDPYQSNHINLLESIQNRAARFIFSDYSYTSSITKLKAQANLPDLVNRRKVARLSLFHKFYHESPCNPAISPAARHSSRLNHEMIVYPPPARTSAHLFSFFVRTPKDWNDLPAAAVAHLNHDHFKHVIELLSYNK